MVLGLNRDGCGPYTDMGLSSPKFLKVAPGSDAGTFSENMRGSLSFCPNNG